MGVLTFIGAALGYGTKVCETQDGPEALCSTPFLKQLENIGQKAIWKGTITASNPDNAKPGTFEALPVIQDFDTKLGTSVGSTLEAGDFPIVIGGDHSIAVGTWSGVTHQLDAEGNFGLIWLDAHMDSHTPATTPSNCIHGMPLAALLGHGDKALTTLISPQVKLKPEHVVLVGVRSYEEGERKLLERLNVRIMYIEEVKQRGFHACFEEALQIAQAGTKGFGVSLDLDMFDPMCAPGVGVPEADGVLPHEAIPSLHGLINNKNLKALELVEFNPMLDRDCQTLTLLQDVIANMLHTA